MLLYDCTLSFGNAHLDIFDLFFQPFISGFALCITYAHFEYPLYTLLFYMTEVLLSIFFSTDPYFL